MPESRCCSRLVTFWPRRPPNPQSHRRSAQSACGRMRQLRVRVRRKRRRPSLLRAARRRPRLPNRYGCHLSRLVAARGQERKPLPQRHLLRSADTCPQDLFSSPPRAFRPRRLSGKVRMRKRSPRGRKPQSSRMRFFAGGAKRSTPAIPDRRAVSQPLRSRPHKGRHPIAVLHTQLSPVCKRGCQGRRLSRARGKSDTRRGLWPCRR
jgi:hypothetical protein